ncbi:hypothetical protein [Acetobacter persici]|uniref:Peptidase M41 domain-containing protein n=1 Tax=Acetobacter persici TaxID=1076596 RepID=A0A6V8I9A8_9PROT|nr:hypothetical protein [Acetobacter persici]OUI93928.1 hypothetical protein HK19_00570 [Acetobacter persici]GFE93894.1 hypothetical protein DmAi_19530 [Acetobacter persici]
MSPEEQERISRHEAGHAVVAIHEGFQIVGIRMTAEGGSAESDARLPGAPIMEYATRRLRVLLGGVVAQCLDAPEGCGPCVCAAVKTHEAKSDWEKAQEVLRFVVHGRSLDHTNRIFDLDEECGQLSQQHFADADAILNANRSTLEELTSIILKELRRLAPGPRREASVEWEANIPASAIRSILGKVKKVPLNSSGDLPIEVVD